MARFRGVVRGSRGAVSRLGSSKSGLVVRADGWHIGVCVECFVDDDGKDHIEVYKTGGSSNPRKGETVVRFEEG